MQNTCTLASGILSYLRPIRFFGGFSLEKALVLDLGPVLGRCFLLCTTLVATNSAVVQKFHAIM